MNHFQTTEADGISSEIFAPAEWMAFDQTTSGEEMLEAIRPRLATMIGLMKIQVCVDELFFDGKLSRAGSFLLNLYAERSSKGLETHIQLIVRSVVPNQVAIVHAAFLLASEGGNASIEAIAGFVDRQLRDNRLTERYLFRLQDRTRSSFFGPRLYGTLDFRATGESVGIDYLSIATPRGTLRLACDRIASLGAFGSVVRLTTQPTFAQQQDEQFLTRWARCESDPRPIHLGGLSLKWVKDYFALLSGADRFRVAQTIVDEIDRHPEEG